MKKWLVIVIVVLLLPGIVYFAFPGLLYKSVVELGRKKVGLTEKSVEVADHTIYYLEGGKGETILLLHGFGSEKDHWLRFAKFLTPNNHVVAMDLPGFGESSKRDKVHYTIGAQVEMLDQFVGKLGLKKFHIVGNSMGGSISGKYTADFPQKVSSLCLIDTGSIHSAEKSEFVKLLESGRNPLVINSVEDFDAFMRLCYFEPPNIPKPFKRYLVKQSTLSRDFNKKIMEDLAGEKYSLEPDLPKIGVQTLILWGEMDRLTHVSATKILEQGLTNSTTAIMKNCGHCPMLERPDETAGYYLRFLAQVREM